MVVATLQVRDDETKTKSIIKVQYPRYGGDHYFASIREHRSGRYIPADDLRDISDEIEKFIEGGGFSYV